MLELSISNLNYYKNLGAVWFLKYNVNGNGNGLHSITSGRMARLKACGLGGSGEGLQSSPLL
jgi:hypothetical protein